MSITQFKNTATLQLDESNPVAVPLGEPIAIASTTSVERDDGVEAVVEVGGDRPGTVGRGRRQAGPKAGLDHVEAKGAPATEAVGEQNAIALHLMLGVVRSRALHPDRNGVHDLGVGSRPTADIDHGQKVGAERIGITRPDVQE